MEWNYGDILDAVALAVPPDRPALIWRDTVVSWAEFDRRTNNIARSLTDLGLRPDDRAAILCRNHPSYMETMVSEVKARVLNVNINYRYTEEEIAYVIDDCQAAAFFYQDAFESMIPSLKARLASVRIWVRIDSDRVARDAPVGEHSMERLATEGDGAPLEISRSGRDGYLLYTGGTTGRPKGVLWPTGQARNSQLESPLIPKVPQSMAEHVETVRANAAPSRIIPACPLMHGSGSNAAMGDLLNGGTAIILPSDRFDPDELWREVGRSRATRIAIVGDSFAKPMLRALDAAPGRYDLSSMKVISSAGLLWSEEVKRGLLRHMPQALMADIVGASEASGLGYSVAKTDHVPATGLFDAGKWTEIIDPDTGEILPKAPPSEGLLARSGAMALGYYGDEKKTAETYRFIDGVRYAVPGDLARWVSPTQFELIGRGNLCINSGGEKVYPEEVEEALKAQPGIEDALVVGRPDERFGKVVVAIVRATDAFDEATVLAGLAKTLAAYKLPKAFVRVEEVPRHESGKADYRTAQSLGAQPS
jgi:fatty-acyl-CoA synthase